MNNGAQGVKVTRRMAFGALPEFLTVPEVMAFLNVGRSVAYQIARSRGQCFGRLLRVPKDALLKAK
jgi:hypothetical protein